MPAISVPRSATFSPCAQLEHDLVLQREDVADAAVDLDRARDLRRSRTSTKFAVMRTSSPRRWKPPTTTHVAPRRRPMSIASDSSRLRVRAQVAQRVEHARAADDRQPVDVLQIRADRLGDAGADPVVGRLAGDVRERHHRDGILDAAGASAAALAAIRLVVPRGAAVDLGGAMSRRSSCISRADW